ncbi:Noc2p family-domain-containing protein [Tribonema minus]|uniref:Noc2p family-domain-containing protein n=1 Tax=Tribonema minus TaxID=303371 RepID=A0A835Z799_9STRA|nr:Noc2p family-domain-containing protein [Tribonema minus]
MAAFGEELDGYGSDGELDDAAEAEATSDDDDDSAADDSDSGAASGSDPDESGDAAVGGAGDADAGDEDDANRHARELRELSEKDPEFYQYLQAEEPDLLEFDPKELEVSDNEAEGEGGEEEGGRGGKKKKGKAKGGSEEGMVLTKASLRALQEAAFVRRSLKGLKRLLLVFRAGCHIGEEAAVSRASKRLLLVFRAGCHISEEGVKQLLLVFRAGCHIGEEADDGDGDAGRGGDRALARRFKIPTGDLYNELMVSCLSNAHRAFMFHTFPDQVQAALSLAERDIAKEEQQQEAAAAAATNEAGKARKRKGKAGETAAAASRQVRLQAAKEARVGAIRLTKADFAVAAKRPSWRAIQPMLYAFLKAVAHVLTQLKDRDLLAFVLRALQHYTKLLVPFQSLARRYLKAMLGLWEGGAAGGTVSDDAAAQAKESTLQVLAFLRVREMAENQPFPFVLAFLRVREMAENQPFPFVEEVLKAAYLAYARNCRFVNEQTLPAITFRGNCIVELYGMDLASAYQLYGMELASAYQAAFVYVRQLALHLRQAIIKKSADAVAEVQRWQYCACLRLWAAVLAAYPGEEQLRALVHPLASVIAGVVRLSPALRHFPLRAHCVRMLHQLAAAARVHIPTAPLLLEERACVPAAAAPAANDDAYALFLVVLHSAALHKRPQPTTAAPPQLHLLVKLPGTTADTKPAQLHLLVKLPGTIADTKRVQDAVVNETFRLLQEGVDLYRHMAAFPETALPLIAELRHFAKSTKLEETALPLIAELRHFAKSTKLEETALPLIAELRPFAKSKKMSTQLPRGICASLMRAVLASRVCTRAAPPNGAAAAAHKLRVNAPHGLPSPLQQQLAVKRQAMAQCGTTSVTAVKWQAMARGVIDSFLSRSREAVARRAVALCYFGPMGAGGAAQLEFEALRQDGEPTAMERFSAAQSQHDKYIAGLAASRPAHDKSGKPPAKRGRGGGGDDADSGSSSSDYDSDAETRKPAKKAPKKAPAASAKAQATARLARAAAAALASGDLGEDAPDAVGAFDPSEWSD